MHSRRLASSIIVAALVACGCSSSSKTSPATSTAGGSTTSTSAPVNSTVTSAPTSPLVTETESTGGTIAATSTTITAAAPLGDPNDCPLGALDKATGPVTIKYWYDSDQLKGQTIRGLVDTFNASQDKIHVDASYHGDSQVVSAMANSYITALGSGAAPDILSPNGRNTQLMIDSHSTVPMGACVVADHADLSDFLPPVVATGMSGATLVAMPWTPAGYLLYYNKKAFVKAGLDPDKPPTTLAEIRTDSEAIIKSGAAKHGISLTTDGQYFKAFLTRNGDPWLTSSGTDGRADAATGGGADGLDLIKQLGDMVATGELIGFAPGPNPDALSAIGSNDSAMAIASAAMLGDVMAALAGGAAPEVEGGVAPIPSITHPPTVNLEGFGTPLWIVKGSDPAKQEAAYRFATWLVQPQQIFTLASATGGFPIRKSAAELPEMQAYWAANPLFRVSYDQVLNAAPAAVSNVRTGASDVESLYTDMMTAVITQGADPTTALTNATTQANAAIAAYNASVTTSG